MKSTTWRSWGPVIAVTQVKGSSRLRCYRSGNEASVPFNPEQLQGPAVWESPALSVCLLGGNDTEPETESGDLC